MANQPRTAGPPWRFVLHVLLYNLRVFLILGAVIVVGGVYLARSLGAPLTLGAIGLGALAGLVLYIQAYQRAAFRETLMTRRPVEDAFRLLATEFFENMDQRAAVASSRIVETAQTSLGPMGVGTTGRQVIRDQDGQVRAEWTLVVTAYILNQEFAVLATTSGLQVQRRYRFARTTGGTKITLAYELRLPGLWRLATPFLASRLRLGYREGIQRLRELLES